MMKRYLQCETINRSAKIILKEETNNMQKSIILFYSLEGNTKKVGKYLSKQLNIPYEEIKPVKDIKSKGFSKYLLGGSQVMMKKKPALIPLKTNIKEYDTIFLGSPIWAGSFTPAIRTILENGTLKGKKIAFFYCNDGGPGKAEKKIEKAVNKNNKLISSYGLTKVKDDFGSLKAGVLKWAKEIEKK